MGERPTHPITLDWIWNGWHAIPASTVIESWRHIGCEKGVVAPHPNPHLVADNDQHNPLALEEGNLLCTKDNEHYNMDDGTEV